MHRQLFYGDNDIFQQLGKYIPTKAPLLVSCLLTIRCVLAQQYYKVSLVGRMVKVKRIIADFKKITEEVFDERYNLYSPVSERKPKQSAVPTLCSLSAFCF